MITINKWKLANTASVKKSYQFLFAKKKEEEEAILALQAGNFSFWRKSFASGQSVCR